MCAIFFPFHDRSEVLDSLLLEKVDHACTQVPAETKIRDLCSKGDRLRWLPSNPKEGGYPVNVGVGIGKAAIFLIAGGRLCQIGEDRATVLIKLF